MCGRSVGREFVVCSARPMARQRPVASPPRWVGGWWGERPGEAGHPTFIYVISIFALLVPGTGWMWVFSRLALHRFGLRAAATVWRGGRRSCGFNLVAHSVGAG